MGIGATLKHGHAVVKKQYDKLTPKQKAVLEKAAQAGAVKLGQYAKNKLADYVFKKPKATKLRGIVSSNFVSTDLHSGISEKHIKVVLNAKRPKKVGGMPITYYESFAGAVTSPGSGYQSCDSFMYGASVKQWTTSTSGNRFPILSVTRYFDLNPEQSTPATTLYGAANLVPLMDRLCLLSCTYYMDFSNFSNVQTTVDIYVLKSKKTHSLSPDTAWSNGLGSEANGLGTTNPVVSSGVATITGALSKYQPFMTPRSKVFSELWAIKKVHRILMAGGSTETVLFDVIHNQVGKVEFFANLPTGSMYVAGTVAFMIICKGSPLHVHPTDG